MTQVQPPPYPPQPGQQEHFASAQTRTAPPPWSAAAIGGFILSLLGFLGVTAVLGLIFGIVGIVTTSGGRRRGMGLAIAAIPISLVTGALSLLLFSVILLGTRVVALPDKLQSVLGSGSSTVMEAADALREMGSSTFNEQVSTEALQAWITQINAKHGKLTSASVDPRQTMTKTSDGLMCFHLKGKFVNGPADIRLVISEDEVWKLHIDDIEIGGTSPRGSADTPSSSTKNEPPPAEP